MPPVARTITHSAAGAADPGAGDSIAGRAAQAPSVAQNARAAPAPLASRRIVIASSHCVKRDRTSSANDPAPFFAVTAPGLERLAATELRALGVPRVRVESGGVSFGGSVEQLYAANVHLRTASRVVVRIASFHASAFHELERRAKQVPWERWVRPEATVRFRVTCRKSRLYHSDAVAERLIDAVASRVTGAVASADAGDADDEEHEGAAAAQLFTARLVHDDVVLSADASGALLHLRGYRQALAKAPLRETLAAAMLLGSGYDGSGPLVDPMCGSGTIAIEGALIARNVAPALATGAPRPFAFEAWPEFDVDALARVVARAREGERPHTQPIVASDRDAGAVAAATANAERAGMSAEVTVEQRPLSALEPPAGVGWLVSNPPYGVRVGERDRLRDLYAAIGRLVRDRLPGWTVALLTAERMLEGQLGLPLEERLTTRNGGIPVRLLVSPRAGVQPAETGQ
jgi:putative N6-adenine-specific DNA methylase